MGRAPKDYNICFCHGVTTVFGQEKEKQQKSERGIQGQVVPDIHGQAIGQELFYIRPDNRCCDCVVWKKLSSCAQVIQHHASHHHCCCCCCCCYNNNTTEHIRYYLYLVILFIHRGQMAGLGAGRPGRRAESQRAEGSEGRRGRKSPSSYASFCSALL